MKKAILISGFLSGALAAAPLFSSAAWGRAALPAVEVRQVFRPERYQRGDTNVSRLQEIDAAHWVWHPTAVSRGEVGKYAFLRFRKEFMADTAPLTFDVSADERFVLLLDGERIAEGPHRGSPENWLYQSYEAKLPPEARSDCHAWGANPLLHLHTDVAGVMPAEPGFKSVRIAPQPGGLKWIDCATPYPKGLIHVKLYFDGDAINGEVTLPDGIGGVFEWKGRRRPLKPGRNAL